LPWTASGNPTAEKHIGLGFILTESKQYKIIREVVSTFSKDIVLGCNTDDSSTSKGHYHIFVFSVYPVPDCEYPSCGNPPEYQVELKEVLLNNLKVEIWKM
jgi:hypothetical protein